MTKPPIQTSSSFPLEKRQRQRTRNSEPEQVLAGNNQQGYDVDVGYCLRQLRVSRSLSIRSLAELSGLNANTLSLIENGKTSPSVSTLQQLAGALDVPITAFFDTGIPKNSITYQKAGKRLKAAFMNGTLEDLGSGLTLRGGQPFLVTLEPGASSGSTPIVHTGLELVFCLEGWLTYTVEEQNFLLEPGDSLLFEAYLPHSWQNTGEQTCRWLLIMCPADEDERPTERHFKPE